MSRFSRPRFLPLLATALTVVAGTTWFLSERPVQAQQPAPARSTYALPAPGTVRVIAHKVRNDANHVEWHWTIVSERYWSGITTDGYGDLELSGGDVALRPDKPNIYDHQLLITTGKNSFGYHLYTNSDSRQRPNAFHGANWSAIVRNGVHNRGGGDHTFKKAVAANKAGRALFTGDKTLTLPVKLPLYERTFVQDGTGKVQRLVSYLVLSK